MNVHTLALTLIIIGVSCFAGLFSYSLKLDALETEEVKASKILEDTKGSLSSAEERRNQSQKRLEEAKKISAQREQLRVSNQKEMDDVQRNIRETRSIIADAEKQLSEVEKQTKDAIEKQRVAAVGVTFSRLVLTNDKVLIDAKLTKFSPKELEFTHSAGKTTARWSLLPLDLIERFDMGSDASGEVITDEESSAEIGKLKTEDSGKTAASAPMESVEQSVNKVRLKNARQSVANLTRTLRAMEAKSARNPKLEEQVSLRLNGFILQVQELEGEAQRLSRSRNE
jgi:hypothetical protein